MNEFTLVLQESFQSMSGYIPTLVGALAILVAGWIIALLGSAVVRDLLSRTKLDAQIAHWVGGDEKDPEVSITNIAGSITFYIIMLFVLVSSFQTLGLTLAAQPLNHLLTQLSEFAPGFVGATLIFAVAWVLATILQRVLFFALDKADLDKWLAATPKKGRKKKSASIAKNIADAVYWLVFLLFLPAMLDQLALQGLLEPINLMVNKILSFVPNIFSAGLLLAVGWFLARIVQRVFTNFLVAVGMDRISDKTGLSNVLGDNRLSDALGTIAYILVFIPVLVSALNALALEAVARPTSNMLNIILESLPALFASALVLVVSYIIGRMVAALISNLLTNAGFNNVLSELGFGKESLKGHKTPSEIVSYIVFIAIMFFALTESFQILGFVALTDLASQFTVFAGHMLMGIVIFAFGLYIANFAYRAIDAGATNQSRVLAHMARISIIVLTLAMSLRQMGLANEIITLAFALLLGSAAVASAIAFGVGGRDIAARELEEWVDAFKAKKSLERMAAK